MRISLVSMPWAIFNRPSIQLGALKSWLNEQLPQHHIDTHHPYLSAAAAIGFERYRVISENPWAGEALFSTLLFPQNRPRALHLFHRELKQFSPQTEKLVVLLEKDFKNWLDDQDFSDCTLLGLSVCFSQLLPSLYAATIIKKRYPDLRIILGGSTCTPTVGASILRTFTDIDFILTGEGEQPLTGLVQYLDGKGPFPDKNILQRQQPQNTFSSLQPCGQIDINKLPLPDYDNYFQKLQTLRLTFIPELPMEFSRGCWWNKCSFCNLNLQWCGYRYKNYEKMTADLDVLSRRYQSLDFFFTDNALPPQEAKKFFQQTAQTTVDYSFFAEIRAPKSAASCHIYRRGGLRTVQIGIEALSDSLLQRMNKGTSVIDNIAAMKFAVAAGIQLDGNLILDFPGSTDKEMEETLVNMDAVFSYHPLRAASFFLGQGSPVSRTPEQYGIRAITHHPNNRLLFPQSILTNLDLLIMGYRGDRVQQQKRWQPVRKKILAWHAFHRQRTNRSKPPLTYRDGVDFILLRQERPGGPTLHHRLKGLSRKIYLACEEPISKKELLQRFKTIKEGQLTAFLDDLAGKHLLYSTTNHCLALAVKENTE